MMVMVTGERKRPQLWWLKKLLELQRPSHSTTKLVQTKVNFGIAAHTVSPDVGAEGVVVKRVNFFLHFVSYSFLLELDAMNHHSVIHFQKSYHHYRCRFRCRCCHCHSKSPTMRTMHCDGGGDDVGASCHHAMIFSFSLI